MPSTVFYRQFERNNSAKGVSAHTTTYCPGCGHGLAQKFLAEAIEELGVKDRTVLISPVGCSVFSYYYFDVGNSQAAHGRAPAVGLGHKTANPESIVVCYQGDGDLASIGLAEIISTAQLGIPLTVIFINNAIYGMTGGQMAPTTLLGQPTSTTPDGRTSLAGGPLRMAELIADLDGPVFVERVALFNNKQRIHAKRAIKRALELQVNGVGFAFIEVLSECPLYLALEPEDAEAWVRDRMVPVFPLGIKKDITTGDHFPEIPVPTFDAAKLLEVLGAQVERPQRCSTEFPSHLDPEDVSIKLAGAGGDGAQLAATVLARAAINEGFDSTDIPSYGPQSRGGTSYADVHIARREVLSPAVAHPHVLVAFNAPSLTKFGPTVRRGGYIVYDSSLVTELDFEPQDDVKLVPVPLARIAKELGSEIVKNIVALGVLQHATRLLPTESILRALGATLQGKPDRMALDMAAYEAGANFKA